MFYPNMNLLRYLLSFGILINHFNVLCKHDIPYFISHDRIGGFFVLSGFLMYHSYMRLSGMRNFVIHRARRILPTYIFIILLCAVAGFFLTSLPVSAYLLNPGFWKYLLANLSFLNWLAPGLPGVFDGPDFVVQTINGSLWTMKVECILDLSVPMFVWVLARTRWRKEYLAVSIVACSIVSRLYIDHLYTITGNELYSILGRQVLTQMGFFYAGMLVYFLRDKINRYKEDVIGIGLVLYLVGPYLPYGDVLIAPIAVAMLFLGVSMIGRTITSLVHVNCISYNIFLVHYPIIQLTVWSGLSNKPLWLSFGFVVLTTVVLALFTNRFIDRRFSTRRNKLPSVRENINS